MSSGTRLFISNLPENVEETDLRDAFSDFGVITCLDLKNKSATSDLQKKIAFITIAASNYEIESCIKHFSNTELHGNKLYVTRARESFLERLQRERDQAQKDNEKSLSTEREKLPKSNPVIKLGDKLNPRKRKLIDIPTNQIKQNESNIKVDKTFKKQKLPEPQLPVHHAENRESITEEQKKKNDSEKKRLDSLKKKRQEFKEKKMIIKTGLTDVDKIHNKRILFTDPDDNEVNVFNDHESDRNQTQMEKKSLLVDDDSGDELNFEIKKHLEGKKGQKVLDLQSKYKSDKRFTLDERFIEDNEFENETDHNEDNSNEEIEVNQTDEKLKQLNILQDVLGIPIKTKCDNSDQKKSKNKIGMFRFDPSQPEHAKFVVAMNENNQPQKKTKKKIKDKKNEAPPLVQTVEVSKEQFYKVSETLKESLVQPTTFSLRSLFSKNEDLETDSYDQDKNYIPFAQTTKPKVKNPLDPGEKNPFVYDSSDSDTEEVPNEIKTDSIPAVPENKAVWKENLFFSNYDSRLKEGLGFFNQNIETETQKERRGLKSLMKKRIYNTERKNQMFQKKIGGRKKTMKKSFRKK